MKNYAIIPIFIPHEGCPNACVFCDQKKITSKDEPAAAGEIAGLIENHLKTLKGRGIPAIEAAFYGGSFTGIPIERQSEYLEIASFYKKSGMINKIRLSTRPDYIDEKILLNLKRYDVDTIELGVQSFDDEVLLKSNRGHKSAVVYESSRMIKDHGFMLGLQLMIGLPGDTPEKDVYSAREAVKIKPQVARLYPTIVIEGTRLHQMYLAGEYTPLTLDESVGRTKMMYEIMFEAGINIIRVGLKSPAAVKGNANFHPEFRQLVESEVAKDAMEELLSGQPYSPPGTVRFFSGKKSFSNMIGHEKSNKIYFAQKYPLYKFTYEIDDSIPDGRYAASYVAAEEP